MNRDLILPCDKSRNGHSKNIGDPLTSDKPSFYCSQGIYYDFAICYEFIKVPTTEEFYY